MTSGTVLAPGGRTDQRTETAGRNRQTVTCGGIGEYSATYAASSGRPTDIEPVSEDAAAAGTCAPRTLV